ncbi:MAG: hypothetical protein JXR07_20655 [Reichenbachiella sp.]
MKEPKPYEIRFAEIITSLGALMLPMLIIICGLAITGGELLHKSFPDSMTTGLKVTASVFFGIILALALTTISVNKDLIKGKYVWIIPLMLAVFSAILLMFFFEVFENWHTDLWHEKFLKIFLSVFFAFLEFIFVMLFIKKLAKSTTDIKLESRIAKLNDQIKKLFATNAKLQETNSQLKTNHQQLIELRKENKKLVEDLTCKKCHKMKKARSIASHENKCKG